MNAHNENYEAKYAEECGHKEEGEYTRTMQPMTIDFMTGVIDKTRGDADSVKYTVIIHDIIEDGHSIIAYDYQIDEILSPHVNPNKHEEEPDFSKELVHAWHWQDYEEAENLMYACGFSIEYFKDFLKENSWNWTYPEGLNHKFTRTRPHVL